MSTDPESMLRDYYASWAAHDPERVTSYFTEGCVFEDLALCARFEGRAGVAAFAELTYRGIPDFSVEPVRLFTDGSQAAAGWVMRGTHSGDMPGLPATGRAFEVRASSLITLDQGRIREMVDYWNLDDLRRAVGLL